MKTSSSKRSSSRRITRGPTKREYAKFSVAHQNVLLERIEKNVQTVAEGHGVLHETIERNHTDVCGRLDRLEKGQAQLEKGQAQLEEGQARLEKGQAQLKSRLDKVEEITLEILQRVKSLEARVEAIETKIEIHGASYHVPADFMGRFQQLEQRVAALESHTG